MRRNATVNWDSFYVDSYRKKHFTELNPEDQWIVRQTLTFLAKKYATGNPIEQYADIGTGPNLSVPLVCAPYAKSIHLIEPASQCSRYLQYALGSTSVIARDWRSSLELILSDSNAHPEHADVVEILKQRTKVHKNTAQSLRPNTYNLLTSIFCAESVTEDIKECSEILQTMLSSLATKGVFIGAFMERSRGWPDFSSGADVDSYKFPSANIKESWLIRQLSGLDFKLRRAPYKPSMRKGYSGVLMVTATKH